MAHNPNILKQFFVGLGFQVDPKSLKGFATTIAVQTEAVHTLSDGVKSAALKIFDFTRGVAESMNRMYYASQRSRSSVANLRAIGFAASQMGLDAKETQATIQGLAESLDKFGGLRGGFAAQIQSFLGGGANLKDTTETFLQLQRRLHEMYQTNPSQALAWARQFQLTRDQILADSDEFRKKFTQEQAQERTFGINQETARRARELVNQISEATQSLQDWAITFSQELMPQITSLLKQVTDWAKSHQGEIKEFFGQAIDILKVLIVWLGKFLVWGEKVAEWFIHLPKAGKVAIAILAGILAGFVALGVIIPIVTTIGSIVGTVFSGIAAVLGLIAAPEALVVAAFALIGTAIYKLYKDYQNFKHGAAHFIPWENWSKEIDGAIAKIEKLASTIKNKLKSAWDSITGNDQSASTAASAAFPKGTPRGIRNNNPGNINFVGQAGATKESGPGGRFAVFQSAQEGLNALAGLLRRYAARGLNTIRAIISKYAPAGENNTNAYIASVAKKLGVGADTQLNLADARQLEGLMGSIVQIENGRNPYTHEQFARAAERSGAIATTNGATVELDPHSTYNIYGATDPHKTAREIGRIQESTNQKLVRRLQPVIS